MATSLFCPYFPLLYLLLHSFMTPCTTQDDLVITTKYGKVQGMLLSVPTGDIRAFLGIPYAKPPTGVRRFHAPEPADRWEGVKNATKYSNSCYQLRDTFFAGFSGAEMWNANTPLSEDCLYLNIWSPRRNGTQSTPLSPVMVWIYGGGFTSGSSSLDLYDGRFLSQTEGVVVVSMNYRIGPLGFVALPNNSNIRGNAGLFDQRLAIKWVVDNIAAFGGDPSKVTLFGESAGAASVGYHLISPGSQGLFQRAVMQSGAPTAAWATLTKNQIWEGSLALAKLLGCPVSPPGDLETCLQMAQPVDILIMQFQVILKPGLPMGLSGFVPHTDGDFLPQGPEELLLNGTLPNVEVLLGLNQDEGTYFLPYGFPGFLITGESLISLENFRRGTTIVLSAFSPLARDTALFEYTPWADQNDGLENRNSLARMVGDRYINCPLVGFAQRYSQRGGRSYVYLFDHRSSTNPWPEWMGVMHGYEIEFVFGVPLNASLGFTDKEVNLTKKIMNHWATFARTGDPNIEGTDWPTFNSTTQEYVTLNANPLLKKRMLKARECQLWNNLLRSAEQVSEDPQSCEHAAGIDLRCRPMFLLIFLLMTLIYLA